MRVEYGYFAAVLVDIDFSKPFPKLVIHDEDFPEGYRLDYNVLNRPEFCEHCKSVGHTFSQCRSSKYKDLEKLHDAEEDPFVGRHLHFTSPSASVAGDDSIVDIPQAFPESASTNLAASSVPLRKIEDDAGTISLDLEKQEEELYKVYDEQKKIVDDMAKAADLAKFEQDVLLEKLQNTRQLLMAKKRQDEEKRAQEDARVLNLEKNQQENNIAQQDASNTSPTRTSRRTSPVRTDEVLETSNRFETGIEDSKEEEENIEVDTLPIKKKPDTLQSASTSNVEIEDESLEWSAAKDEEERLKRELAEKNKMDTLVKNGAPKMTPKKKTKPVAKQVEDEGQAVRRGRSQTRKEDDKGSASPSRSVVK
ncbi:SWI5-dependent HO expression protein 3-like [Papaver somniferum]|uniref:SWI5-dependent HO expression protein 3-like n=1 Tax=Papaver somniferum TaxID=3469 RepID=UPI000E6F6286|nr:SWI5-dependent HO expression protein 3-like [Papaver somniferum]